MLNDAWHDVKSEIKNCQRHAGFVVETTNDIDASFNEYHEANHLWVHLSKTKIISVEVTFMGNTEINTNVVIQNEGSGEERSIAGNVSTVVASQTLQNLLRYFSVDDMDCNKNLDELGKNLSVCILNSNVHKIITDFIFFI